MKLYTLITSEKVITQANKFRLLTLGLVLGFIAGRTTQELQHYRSVETIHNLHVLGNDGADTYTVETERHNIFTLKFCGNYIPEFPTDSFLEWVKFEQTPACLNIRDHDLGFKILRDRGVAVKYSKLK